MLSTQLSSKFDKVNSSIPRLRLCLIREQIVRADLENKKWPGAQVENDRFAVLRSPEDVFQILPDLANASEEHFVSLHLNSQNEILGVHEVSHGTLSTSLVHPREVFKAALLANSFALVVCHNHPSGANIDPSQDDYETTKKLIEVGRLIGIPLLDHVILGPSSPMHQRFYSFREHYDQLWQEPKREVC